MKYGRSMVLFGLFICAAVAQQPTVNQNGVVNAASYATANPPGSLVTIFGTNMAGKAGELLIASTVPLSMHLKGQSDDISATVSGKPAPMYYATTTQSSVQVPWSVPAGTASIVVTRNGNSSSPQAMQVATFSPGIFTVSQDGKGMAWVINNNDGAVAQPSAGWPFPKIKTRAAKAGDNLFLYATGLGPVVSPPADGASPCPASGCPSTFTQTAKTTTRPTVLINGTAIADGNLQFSGLTPFYPGVYQLNFQVPSGVAAGDKTTLQIQIGGATSNQVTFATQ